MLRWGGVSLWRGGEGVGKGGGREGKGTAAVMAEMVVGRGTHGGVVVVGHGRLVVRFRGG